MHETAENLSLGDLEKWSEVLQTIYERRRTVDEYPKWTLFRAIFFCTTLLTTIGKHCAGNLVSPGLYLRPDVEQTNLEPTRTVTRLDNRDLKQARTATAVNKQLNFTVKNKPRTTNYIYCIFEAYFMIKSV